MPTIPLCIVPNPPQLRAAGIHLTQAEHHDAPNRAPQPLYLLELPEGSRAPYTDMHGHTVVALPCGSRLRVVPGRGGEPARGEVMAPKRVGAVAPWMLGSWGVEG